MESNPCIVSLFFVLVALSPTSVVATDCGDGSDGSVANCCYAYNGYCDSCQTGYTLTNGNTKCTKCTDPACQICEKNKPDTCTQKGVPPPKHCVQPQSNNWCLECEDGYGLVAESKNAIQTSPGVCLKCTVPNCSTCDGTAAHVGTCTGCTKGYTAIQGKCVRCGVKNCYSCSKGINTCTMCNDNYVLVSSKQCVKCAVKNCSLCSNKDPNSCFYCDQGYAAISGSCVKCKVDNCSNCKGDPSTCQYCTYPLNVSNGKCVG